MTIANAKPDLLITGPLGTTTVNAASSLWSAYTSVEAKITAAIAYAVSIGAKAVYVPDCFLPYTASQVTFNSSVHMTREGGSQDAAIFDAIAYGADASGVADSTIALNKVLVLIAAGHSSALGAGVPGINSELYLPTGNYRTTATLGPARDWTRIRGSGRKQTFIRCETDNTPILQWGGYYSTLLDLTLTYLNEQGTANTGAVGVALYNPIFCYAERVEVLHSNYGWQLFPGIVSGMGAASNNNFMQGSEFHSLFIQASKVGFECIPTTAGNEGNIIEELTCSMRNDATAPWACDYGVSLTSCSDFGIMRLSVLGGKCLDGVLLASCDTISISNYHFEGNTPRAAITSVLNLSGGTRCFVGSLFVGFNSFLNANGVTTASVFRVGGGAKLVCAAVSERNNTVTGASFLAVNSDAGSTPPNAVWIHGQSFAGASHPAGFYNGIGILRQYGTALESWSTDRGDASVTLTAGFDATIQWFNTPLTTGRTVTLSTTGAVQGDKYRITRSAAATGASTLTVGAKTLAVGQWIEVVYDGAAWQETAFGSL